MTKDCHKFVTLEYILVGDDQCKFMYLMQMAIICDHFQEHFILQGFNKDLPNKQRNHTTNPSLRNAITQVSISNMSTHNKEGNKNMDYKLDTKNPTTMIKPLTIPLETN